MRDPLGRQDGGFVYTLVAGVVAVTTINTSYFLTWALNEVDGGWLPARVSAVVAAIVPGLSLTPALVRRAARPAHGHPGRLGAAGGRNRIRHAARRADPARRHARRDRLDPRRDGPAPDTHHLVPGRCRSWTGHAHGQHGQPGCRRRPHSRQAARTAWLTATACGCAAAALWPIPGFTTGQTWWHWGTDILPADQWHWLAVPYLATVLLLTAKNWQHSGHARDAAVLVITPACAAAVGERCFSPASTCPRSRRTTWSCA